MGRLRTVVAVVLGVLAIPSLPWLVLAFPPVAEQLSGVPYGWGVWLDHVVTVAGFSIAACLAYAGARHWPIASILMCGYVALVATPPFIRMSLDGGFLTLTDLIWRQAVSSGGARGFYLVWNLIVLPILPALVLPVAAWTWWQTREVAKSGAI
ncbi:MAG TPA: hypothetical protein VFB99_18075 [Vicinamibacterales bacterium]|nr:hypothetical protein [Vicinamibacterales bacterium]HZM33796.1 hypothetical protein [Burkholderiales bacterium]